PMQYADYSLWQRGQFSGPEMDIHLDYWKNHLKGVVPLDLPTDYVRKKASSKGRRLTRKIEKSVVDAVLKLSSEHNATCNMIYLTAFNALLCRYTGQNDICIGTSVANRNHVVTETLIGCFTNLIALRNTVSFSSTFSEVISGVKQNLLESLIHQDCPFEKVIENIHVERNQIEHPLFQILFVMQDAPDLNFNLEGISLSQLDIVISKSQFDILFNIVEDNGKLFLNLDYNSELYEEKKMENMLAHYLKLLNLAVHFPNQIINNLDFLSLQEKDAIFSINNNKTEYPRHQSLHDLFNEQVVKSPDKIAVVYGENSFSYGKIQKLSSSLGFHLLKTLDNERKQIIGILLNRSEKLIVSMMSVLKTGKTYLFISPAHPVEILKHIIKESDIELIITDSKNVNKIIKIVKNIINLDEIDLSGEKILDGKPISSSNDEACVIYTSGTTGTPKGVIISHKNIISLVRGINFVDFKINDTVLSTGSPSFDASTFEYWGMLLNGGTMIIPKESELLDAKRMQQLIERHEVKLLWLTAGLFNQFVDDDISLFRKLITVIAGGERLSEKHVSQLKRVFPDIRLLNGYGPTENTTFSLIYLISDCGTSNIPIGRPLNNRIVYILNADLGLMPVGAIGEIFVGGDGISKGYLNNRALTEEKFLLNPFSDKNETYIYRTGDYGRLLETGEIQFLGRKDQQIKIRGFRVELEAIEYVLGKYDAIDNVILSTRDNSDGDKEILVYFVSAKKIEISVLKAFLNAQLPEYMIPNFFVQIPTIPLTDNGKVNKKLLPEPIEKIEVLKDGKIQNVTSQILKEIWQDVLSVKQISLTESFFSIGGDSIKAIRVVSKINKVFNIELGIADFFELESIENLSVFVDKFITKDESYSIRGSINDELDVVKNNWLQSATDVTNVEDIFPMSDIQAGMIYASLFSNEIVIYNDQFVYQIPEILDITLLKKAFSHLVLKHPMLRTGFSQEGVQIVYRNIEFEIQILETSLKGEAKIQFIRSYLEEERINKFDVFSNSLWKISIIQSQLDSTFVFQFHHAVLDGWSLASLNSELFEVYQKFSLKKNPKKIDKLKCSYRDFVIERILDKKLKLNLAFWKNEMTDYIRTSLFNLVQCREEFSYNYDHDTLQILRSKTDKFQISIKALFLGAFLFALKKMTFENELTIGLVSHNRPAIEDGDKILGCFLNTVPFRFCDFDQFDTLIKYLSSVEDKLRTLRLVDRTTLVQIKNMVSEKSENTNPFFDVIFNYVDFHIYNDIDKSLTVIAPDEKRSIFYGYTNTFLDLNIHLTGDKLSIAYFQTRNLLSGKDLNYIHQSVNEVVKLFLLDPGSGIDTLNILPGPEVSELFSFNPPVSDDVSGSTLLDLFHDS
ncbi:amino acid adenylation domain-containing protein, partial [Pedobacter jeongneungensis]|uniref:amino acid adenylation domain-containing protein n=1 Tax=Pedobacter jeongneungensis TaxID=947309 RepID=UPI0031F0D72A